MLRWEGARRQEGCSAGAGDKDSVSLSPFNVRPREWATGERELESSNMKVYLPSLEVLANIAFVCVIHKS